MGFSFDGDADRVIGVDSKDIFYRDLKGKTDPEEKRKKSGVHAALRAFARL